MEQARILSRHPRPPTPEVRGHAAQPPQRARRLPHARDAEPKLALRGGHGVSASLQLLLCGAVSRNPERKAPAAALEQRQDPRQGLGGASPLGLVQGDGHQPGCVRVAHLW